MIVTIYKCWICKRLTIPDIMNEKMHQCKCFYTFIHTNDADKWDKEGVYEVYKQFQ